MAHKLQTEMGRVVVRQGVQFVCVFVKNLGVSSWNEVQTDL